jgi:PAS domain S-box-containing protein
MPTARPRRPRHDSSARLDDGSQTWLAILDQMPIGVTVLEVSDGRFILQNSAARQILGKSPGPEDGQGVFLRYGAGHDGQPYAPDEFPVTRALANGGAVEREPMYYRHPDGRTLVLEVNASCVKALDGRQLGVCTFQDVTEEYERRRALKETAERVQLALDAGAIVGTWVWNPQADAMTADELFAHSFGMDPERCRTGFKSEEALVSVHPADLSGLEAAVMDVLAHGGPYRHQYRVRREDGSWRWIEASGRVELDARGEPVRFPGVLLDINAWKHAEEARTLLMREVDHRARNALAMVQSLVRLTDASDPARYRDEVVGRIDAMARAQGSLSRTSWEGAPLADVLRDEIAAYAPAEKFALEGARITLPAEQVQPINMIAHELVTNSMKYGALSTPAGRLAVSWRALGPSAYELTWREHGGPAVRPPGRKGFGSRLIERLAAQLGGEMEMDWRPAGLQARLSWLA